VSALESLITVGSQGMTPGEISGYTALLAVLCKFALDAYTKHAAAKRDSFEAEAKERAAEAERNARAETWLRERVDEMVTHERELYRVTIADMQRRIEALESALSHERTARAEAEERLSLVPALAEDLARALSRVDPARTPTSAEIDHLRRAGNALGLTAASVNGLVIGRGNT